MQFLHFLEKIRMPWLNDLMLGITFFGEETAFLVIALIVFWCVDKYHGYYMLGVGLFGNMANQFLKILCRIPRPWVKDSGFQPVEGAIGEATGYSFPSGHSQTAVGTFGCIAATQKNRIIRGICIAMMILVPFSRMYLGVHTPEDVLVGGGMALLMVLVFRPLMLGRGEKNIPWMFAAMLVLNVAYLLYVHLYSFPAEVDAENYGHAVENGYTFLGCFVGILIIWFADEKKLRFSTKAVWWAQILKAVLGLVAVLIVKEGMRSPLEAICGSALIARAVRYCLIVVVAGIVWPLTFSWFGKLGNRKENAK